MDCSCNYSMGACVEVLATRDGESSCTGTEVVGGEGTGVFLICTSTYDIDESTCTEKAVVDCRGPYACEEAVLHFEEMEKKTYKVKCKEKRACKLLELYCSDKPS